MLSIKILVILLICATKTLQDGDEVCTDANTPPPSTVPSYFIGLISHLPIAQQNKIQDSYLGDIKKAHEVAMVFEHKNENKSDEIDHELKPINDLICAMLKMKSISPLVFYARGIAFMKPIDCEWPERIYEIRKTNDRNWDSPHSSGWKRLKCDNDGYKQWYTAISQDPEQIQYDLIPRRFQIAEPEILIPQFKEFAKNLQDKLNQYYDNFNETEKMTRYPGGKDGFYRHFAAIIQRSYRIGYNFFQVLVGKMLNKQNELKYMNGTAFSLHDALLTVMPTWYFDDEHIDMLNILQHAQGYLNEEDYFYHALTTLNVKKEWVVIPGFRNCGEPGSTDEGCGDEN